MKNFNFEPYDLLDIGTGKGLVVDFAKKYFGVQNAVTIEVNEHKVSRLKQRGYNCIHGNVLNLAFPKRCVNIVTLSHVLEHLPTLADAEQTVAKAVQAAKQFVYLESPAFDFDTFLHSHGLKFYWSDWHGHTTKITVPWVIDTLHSFGITHYSVLYSKPIKTSNHLAIHSLASTTDQFAYDREVHPKKPLIEFRHPLFGTFIVYIWINPEARSKALLKLRPEFKLRFEH